MIATFEDFDRLYRAVSGHKVKCDRCNRPIYGTMLTGLSEHLSKCNDLTHHKIKASTIKKLDNEDAAMYEYYLSVGVPLENGHLGYNTEMLMEISEFSRRMNEKYS